MPSAKTILKQAYKSAQKYANSAAKAQTANNRFNAQQAQLERDWSHQMSATAHQREVADLKAAGINPVLSAYSGGAAAYSGSAATADNGLTGAYATLASNALQIASSLSETMLNNAVTRKVTKMQVAAQKFSAKTSAKATKYAAKKSAAATRYAAEQSAAAQRYSAEQSAEASKYAAQLARQTGIDTTRMTNRMNKQIAKLNNLSKFDCATIAARAGVKQSEIQAFASKYASKLSYLANMKETKSKEYREMMKTVTNGAVSIFNTSQTNATRLISGLLGKIKLF